jgi:ligand-binding sensor domain-containing protein
VLQEPAKMVNLRIRIPQFQSLRNFFSTLLVSILQLLSASISGQQPIFKTYTVSDGLVNNSVRRIFQDSKGFLWIATWEGLSKYDGNRFTNFTEGNGLSHSMVNDIYESAYGKLYLAENNGTVDVL